MLSFRKFFLISSLFFACCFISCGLPLQETKVVELKAEMTVKKARLFLEIIPERGIFWGDWYGKLKFDNFRRGQICNVKQNRDLSLEQIVSGKKRVEFRYFRQQQEAAQRLVAISTKWLVPPSDNELQISYSGKLPALNDKLKELDFAQAANWLPFYPENSYPLDLTLIVSSNYLPQVKGKLISSELAEEGKSTYRYLLQLPSRLVLRQKLEKEL